MGPVEEDLHFHAPFGLATSVPTNPKCRFPSPDARTRRSGQTKGTSRGLPVTYDKQKDWGKDVNCVKGGI